MNVNWRWNMPQVGTPNYGSEQNAKYLNEGLDAIAAGIVKGGENRRADEKQKWLEDITEQKFAHQKYQDMLAQQNANRNYMLQRDIFRQNKKKSDFDMGRQSKQDEWLQKFYDQYFGDDPEEIERLMLLEELNSLPQVADLFK